MNASDIMTRQKIWSCSGITTVQDAAKIMLDHDVGSVPVLDNQGRLEGMVTDRDLCCQILGKGRSASTPVGQVMSRPVQFVHPDASLENVEAIMRDHKIRRLPVVDDDMRLQGFISLSNLLRACSSSGEEHELVSVLESICEVTPMPAHA